MQKTFFIIGCVMAFLGVLLGAFGAHVLKNIVNEYSLSVFEVGVRYQMYHAFALFTVSYAYSLWPNIFLQTSGWFFIIGVILFSGSLYMLSITGIKWLGLFTPIGGFLLLGGWACLAWSSYKGQSSN